MLYLVNLDLGGNQILNVRMQALAAHPGSPTDGLFYWNTTDKKAYIYDATNTTWLDMTGSGGGGDADTLEGESLADVLARANHTGTQAASTISDLATVVQAYRLDQFAAPTASVAMNSQKITGLLDPTSAQDAATKAYVDAVAQGLDVKDSVKVVALGGLSLGGWTRTGNVIMSDSPEAFGDMAIDGVSSFSLGDRILFAGGGTAADYGIYTVTDVGGVGEWELTRATDADTSAKVTAGMYTFVDKGTTYANSGWALATDDPITLNTTSLAFTQFSGAGQITAGTGISKSGNTLSVDTAVVARKYTANIGDNSAAQFTLTHNLGTRAVTVEVMANSGDYPTVLCDVERTSDNAVRLTFATVPTTDQYKVIIVG